MQKLAKIKFNDTMYVVNLSDIKYISLIKAPYDSSAMYIRLNSNDQTITIYSDGLRKAELEETFNDLYTKWDSWTKAQNDQDERLCGPMYLTD